MLDPPTIILRQTRHGHYRQKTGFLRGRTRRRQRRAGPLTTAHVGPEPSRVIGAGEREGVDSLSTRLFVGKCIIAIVAAGALAGLASYFGPAAGQADQEASPIYGIKIPKAYRSWQLISVNHLAGGNLKQVRAQLGNDIAMKAFRERKLTFPDGTIIAALHWNEVSSDENDKILAMGFPCNLSLPGPL